MSKLSDIDEMDIELGLCLLLIEVSGKNFKFTSNFTSNPIG